MSTTPAVPNTAPAAPANDEATQENPQTSNIDPNVLALLRDLPDVFNKAVSHLAEQGSIKKAAAEALSNLAHSMENSSKQPQATADGSTAAPQAATASTSPAPVVDPSIHPQLQNQEPGPSSHPNGPPTLGLTQPTEAPAPAPTTSTAPIAELASPASQEATDKARNVVQSLMNSLTFNSGGRRRNAYIGSEEWSRQRKDNHKEVERRRRGNINEGINELARIVPNGNGEKAKGAILNRSIQYIHHLKENEARNIEKWTLEKLLMDQAMGDLQAQLEEVKRLWEEERRAREKAETEVATLKATIEKLTGTSGSKKRVAGSSDEKTAEDERGAPSKAPAERSGKKQKTSA